MSFSISRLKQPLFVTEDFQLRVCVYQMCVYVNMLTEGFATFQVTLSHKYITHLLVYINSEITESTVAPVGGVWMWTFPTSSLIHNPRYDRVMNLVVRRRFKCLTAVSTQQKLKFGSLLFPFPKRQIYQSGSSPTTSPPVVRVVLLIYHEASHWISIALETGVLKQSELNKNASHSTTHLCSA